MGMRYYETLFFMNPNLAEEDYKDAIAKFNRAVENHQGVVIKTAEWGKKTLAYEVKKFDRGYYVLMNFCGGPDVIYELQREMRLDDRVLKYQTIKLADQVDPEALKAQETETKAPETVAKAPEAQVKVPEVETKAPEAEAKAPEAEVKAPEAEVKAPEAAEAPAEQSPEQSPGADKEGEK